MEKNYKTKKEEMENGKIAGNAVVFENPEFGKIRTLTDENGEPLFCAKDVCDILGYKKSRNAVNQLVNHLDALKQGVKVSGSLRKDGSRTVRTQQMLFVNESGFYALVLGSKLPTAVKFKNWVTSEVLPQIRKTGGYIPVKQGESDEETIRHAEEILRATLKEKENLLKNQQVQIDQQKKLIGEQDMEIRRLNGVIHLFGNEDVTAVRTTVGPEQEYFLVDKSVYDKRKDLIYTGRTLFGAKPPKGQELDDHYFGSIKPRVAAFMKDLDEELWKLGVYAKTEHNEVAPAQHELAPVFTTGNIAADQNQLTMEIMQKVAARHGMVCLLHEKPFAGVNGSGKHNNWSLTTDTGMNLLEPGETPAENAQFLLFLCAVIQAVDDYQDMLRISVASAANDHRLGANEAPPAVVSMYVGDEIESILDAIVNETPYAGQEKELLKIGVHALPRFPKDTTDRNRTSPFAFTGNKFEFRMPGSSASISGINVVLNTAVAESLEQFADALEGSKDFEADLQALIRSVLIKHKRILFNGNGYDDAWLAEAERRGLLNLRTTPEALPYYLADKNVALFTKHRVYTRTEMEARYEIHLENYSKVLNIEALTMLEMARRDIMPAVSSYLRELSETAAAIHAASVTADCSYEESIIPEMSALLGDAYRKVRRLDEALMGAKTVEGSQALANYYRDKVFSAMAELRITIDQLETMTPSDKWPVPSYGDLLFSVR